MSEKLNEIEARLNQAELDIAARRPPEHVLNRTKKKAVMARIRQALAPPPGNGSCRDR